MGLLDNQTQQDYYSGNDFGGYQFISLNDIINNFIVAYVGDGKIIPKAKRTDIAFHAQRAIQELSFDTFKSIKSQEITLPPSNTMVLPQDYVNYTRVLWTDSSGIKRPIYPTKHTQNPNKPQIDSDNNFLFDASGDLISSGNLITNGDFHGGSAGWTLNETNYSSGTLLPRTATTLSATPTLGDPDVGWFYGFDGNAVGAYNLPAGGYWGISQGNVPIIGGEEYKITYTLSGYTSGSWKWYIIDGEGDSSGTTEVTANGTYEETITAGGTNANYAPNTVFFRNEDDDNDGNVVIDNISIVRVGDKESSTTWGSYSSTANSSDASAYNYDTDIYDLNLGQRYGLEPSIAQSNGTYFIDTIRGLIHFSSNLTGRTIVLDYISDGLGTDEEMIVHKFAEEAMYKSIAYAIFSTTIAGQQLVPRFKKEKFAAIRQAKLRLSNLKIEELAQMMRGKSKFIKH